MPASKLAAQHSPCTLLQRLPSRDNSSKRVKLLRLMGSPLFPSPYPPPRFVVGSFRFWGRIGYCAVERGRVLLFTRGIFFHTVNSVTSYQLPVISSNSQLLTPPPQITNLFQGYFNYGIGNSKFQESLSDAAVSPMNSNN